MAEDFAPAPHGPIERLEDNLWRVEGTLPNMPLKRVMTVVKLADGKLLIHNAIALEPSAMAELEAWGTPAFLVVPNRYHRLDASAYKRRYPALRVLCPRGAREHVEQVVGVDLTCEAWAGDEVAFEHIEGTNEAEVVMKVRSGDGTTLVFTDLIFNMPHMPGFSGFVLRYLTGSSGGPRVTRIAKLMMIDDRQRVRAHLERLARGGDLRRIVVSHHEMIEGDCQGVLHTVAKAL